MLYDAVKATLDKTSYLFRYDVHEAELREFIKQHLSESSELIQINKNNFVSIYQRWLIQVQPSIDVDWASLKKLSMRFLVVFEKNSAFVEHATRIYFSIHDVPVVL